MNFRQETRTNPKTFRPMQVYLVEGIEVTKKEYDRMWAEQQRGKPKVHLPVHASGRMQPLVSESMAVNSPEARQNMVEMLAKAGVPTHVDRHGRPCFTSLNHRRKVMKLLGWHDRQSFD